MTGLLVCFKCVNVVFEHEKLDTYYDAHIGRTRQTNTTNKKVKQTVVRKPVS